MTGLPKGSAAYVFRIVALDQVLLDWQAGHIPRSKVDLLLAGLGIFLGR